MVVTFLIAAGMLTSAIITNNDVKMYILIFFAVGSGLGLLRVFVNSSIKRMKGKGWLTKVLFFAGLLGIGLPFQAWFRNNVLFSMDSAYLARSIISMVLGVFFMTTFFSYMTKKRKVKSVQ